MAEDLATGLLQGFRAGFTGVPQWKRDEERAAVERKKREAELMGRLNQQKLVNAGLTGKKLQMDMDAPAKGPSIGQYNPRDYTVESFAKFVQSQNPSDLVRAQTRMSADQEYLVALERARGKSEGGKSEDRRQTSINEGVDAVKGIPILRRSMALLDRVDTGGFDSAALRAKQLFGVEGADEGELSANLGKSVLSQLRSVFGAAFTEKEGARLERIEAGFGKSAATNKRLLKQILRVIEGTAQRALDRKPDSQTRDEINDFLEGRYDLTDEALQSMFSPQQRAPRAPQAQQRTVTVDY